MTEATPNAEPIQPHPYLRIDDTRCATCGRRKEVCEAEWEAAQTTPAARNPE